MKRTLHYVIEEKDQGMRIGEYLRSCGYSRHMLTQMKQEQGAVSVHLQHAPCKLYMPLSVGDILEVTLCEEGDLFAAPPVDIPLSIIYEDEDILVLDKPPFMPVHPSQGHRDDTLANAVNYYYAQQGTSIIYRCINRLDRDTSGLLIVAKHTLAAAGLSAQMKARQIHRTYLAIAHGHILSAGTIDAPIARVEGSTIERCVDKERGERAVTHYRPLAYDTHYDVTLLEVKLETGRTHQIRVHLTAIGHPLAGDFLYVRPDLYPDTHLPINRQALHSHALIFHHPVTGKEMSFTSSLPQDLCFADFTPPH